MISVLFLKFVGRVKNKKNPLFWGWILGSLLFSMFNVDSWTGCGKSLIYQLAALSTSPSSLL